MNHVIIIGDSTHNTLSAVRSCGEANIPQTLILVGNQDTCFVRCSKYLRNNNLFRICHLDQCLSILTELQHTHQHATLITTFDLAAEWVDAHEPLLSKNFSTPCRGKQLAHLFNKVEQCKLAAQCGLAVPLSIVYEKGAPFPKNKVTYPFIIKPLISSAGEKSDIHICKNEGDLPIAFQQNSHCSQFLIQQFIDKEYEINILGASTDRGVVLGGGIHKIRHWPPVIGAASFGIFKKVTEFNINVDGIEEFIKESNYHGPFSIELLHATDGNNYFMEMNFRNDGLAYVATCAGANLHALYLNSSYSIDWNKFRPTYMMNYSIDFLYVKKKKITFWRWINDCLKTRCFINLCFSDLAPLIAYYKLKLSRKK